MKLLGRFEYYIGNDTGLSHLASLLVPKVLVILGGGTFLRFFPWPDREGQYIIFYGLDCYDCNWYCKYSRPHCLERICARVVAEYFLRIFEGENLARIINAGEGEDFNYQLAWWRFADRSGWFFNKCLPSMGKFLLWNVVRPPVRAALMWLFPDMPGVNIKDEATERMRKILGKFPTSFNH